MNLQYVYSFIRFLLIIAILLFSLVALYYVAHVTYPFIIALILAFMINPIVNLLERKGKMPRGLAVFVVILILIGLIVGFVTLIISEMISGFGYLAEVIPEHTKTLVQFAQTYFTQQILPIYYDLAAMFQQLDPAQQETITNNIESVGKNITTNVREFVQSFLTGLQNFLLNLPNVVTVLIFSLLATFFISKDWYRFQGWIAKRTPKRTVESGQSVYRELRKALFGFMKAQLTLISITAAIVLVGLLILQVDYAITIAILTGVVDLLPYLGTGAVFIPWIIYSFIIEDFTLSIGLSILYGVVIIQRQIMEPKILSSSIGLDPLATLISLFVGFKLFGFLGLIIGPVILVIIRALNQADVFQDLWSFIIGKKAS
ncbi:sporulation integral membrane protein YtvI [Alkalihalobacillus sp. AL-G]|uniref:sporulation integral membrane protein YtvI n=1 Tax=Alkalihalobacillus sp. AL-G TaxID=2926399 RepID=UPI00272C5A96|nr:sporulation integral membrane protein YtvI [Alkalihalobacillus sp. AL-G]WLD92348.1 sporulation integral membrane protein YtvI [Alkalihalobacillus sp. AL-G]